MEKQSLSHQVGQAGGILVRLEGDLGRAKGELNSATRNLTTGGIILLVGLLSLIGYFAFDSGYIGIVAAVALFIGGVMVGLALVKIFKTRQVVNTTSGKITGAQAELDDLKAQSPVAE